MTEHYATENRYAKQVEISGEKEKQIEIKLAFSVSKNKKASELHIPISIKPASRAKTSEFRMNILVVTSLQPSKKFVDMATEGIPMISSHWGKLWIRTYPHKLTIQAIRKKSFDGEVFDRWRLGDRSEISGEIVEWLRGVVHQFDD
uniref:Carotenoid 9 109' 10'-cleavage dioxygenase 1-like n=1 Tax=Rhizophora mucronata TaxID=61149 RepID=A0A2P2LL78_RHIMU